MKGIEFDPVLGRIEIVNGSRTVSTTDGTLVCLLPTLVEVSTTAEFPDPSLKDYAYCFKYAQTRVFDPSSEPDHYRQTNACQTFFTRRPQEFLQSANLIAAPAGADIFVGQVRVSRTVSPSHTWAGDTLRVLPKEAEWIPLTGSLLMEEGLALSRALHIYPEDGFLKIKRQMSVGPSTGGYGTQGSFGSPAASTSGREVLFNAGPGVLAWTSTSSPYAKNSFRDVDTDLATGPSDYTPQRLGGSNACSISDPTDYRSLYSVDVQGYFGRRS